MKGSVSDFGRDHGLIHEVIITGRKVGWAEGEWAKLAHNQELMEDFLKVLLGEAHILPCEHVINCKTRPFIPKGWTLERHRKRKPFTWGPDRVKLFCFEVQKDHPIAGDELYRDLAVQPVLNANVLDYLLQPENQHLIPKEWKDYSVFFWGTSYRDSRHSLCIRCLEWDYDRGAWRWNYGCVEDYYGFASPALLAA